MHLICPSCQSTVELTGNGSPDEVQCPSCGSSFRVQQGSTTAWAPGVRRTLGKFELLDEVGSGSFGTVYKARDPELDRTVAIKVPRATALPTRDDLERFLREARSVAQLRHPSIIPIHDVGQQDGVPYLVSDFVAGLTLADLVSGRPAGRHRGRCPADGKRLASGMPPSVSSPLSDGRRHC